MFAALTDRIMKKIILCSIILAATLLSTSAKEQYVYTQIAQNEGLTSTVNCIYKEKDGDVWIGTPSGLHSFNGYTLRHYDNLLFGGRKVYQICPDKDNCLWIATDRSLIRRNPETEAFEKISSADTLVKHPFYSILPDSEGIWVGGLGRLYRYSHKDSRLRTFCITADDFDFRNLTLIDSNTLLCTSNNGKLLVDTTTGDISKAHFGDRSEVAATLVDSNGRIWISFYNNGIEVFEKDGTKVRSYNTSNSKLSSNLVLCLDQQGPFILAGTDGGGINIIDFENDTVRTLTHISGDPSSFPANSIKSIHTDHYGNIWAGSIRDGLISISLSEINSYQDTHIGLTNGLSNPTVLCIHQGRISNYIWIGTDGEGLNRFNAETSKFTHYPSTFKTKIVSIADYSDNELALSVFADNIWVFNKITGEMRPLNITDPAILHKIRHSGRTLNIYNENDGDLLLFAKSIFRYNKATGHFKPISGTSKNSSDHCIIGRTKEGVWMHSESNIYLLKEDEDRLTLKGRHDTGEIRCGHIAPDGIIWLATEEGLCNFNPETREFRHINTSVFSDANSVVCDNHSRVWVGTDSGLSAYLTESGTFTYFDESDGVKPNEFLPKPHLLSTIGDVYLGGVHGMLRIRESYSIDTTDEPILKLHDLIIDGEDTDIPANGYYKTPRGSKKIALGLSVLEKDMFRHRKYRFILSDSQIYETSIPSLSLRMLPKPGTYNIKVSCTKRTGEWTEPSSLLTLKVHMPWFLTWWFIGGCVLLLALTYLIIIYTLQRRKASELRMAMKEQEQKVYEEKVNMLINVSHELRTPLTLIMAPLRRLLKEIGPEEEHSQTLGRIYRQSRRMRSLLDMVLDLRKMEVEGNRMKVEEVDFNSWIAESADDIVNEEKAEGISIRYEFDPAVTTAQIDKVKCDIVLMNILINAIKHSSAGETITIRTALTGHGTVRTSISDQGPGLGPDVDLDRIFTQFYQSNSEKYGSGIGLSYSKILVDMHKGTIGAENNPDKGATFWWEVPVVAEGVEVQPRAYLNELLGHSAEALADSHTDVEFSTKGMKLMLVDDNQDLLDFLRESLNQDFAEIITVTGGKSALKALSEDKLPDIIVSDVNMPEGDGFWLCKEVKSSEKYGHIPFVLLTARGEDQSQSDSYRLGADGFLAKPFETETLLALIRGLLKRKAEIRKKYLESETAPDGEYGSNEERFILQLNKIIERHISDPNLDQQLLCKELGMSRALLFNKMKAITGAGTKEYITRIRIEKAKKLIEKAELTIAEISDATGFASASYFSTAFKNYEGMTPSQYKQSAKHIIKELRATVECEKGV